MSKPFGTWIKQHRRAKGIGRLRCAGYAAIGGEALRLIENGTTIPGKCKLTTIYGLAKILDLDLAEVVERAAQEDEEYMKWLGVGMEFYAKRKTGDT